MSHLLFLSFSSIEKSLEFLLTLRPNGLLLTTQDIYRDLGLFKEVRVEKMEVLKILRLEELKTYVITKIYLHQ
jgi:hypothetical protein